MVCEMASVYLRPKYSSDSILSIPAEWRNQRKEKLSVCGQTQEWSNTTLPGRDRRLTQFLRKWGLATITTPLRSCPRKHGSINEDPLQQYCPHLTSRTPLGIIRNSLWPLWHTYFLLGLEAKGLRGAISAGYVPSRPGQRSKKRIWSGPSRPQTVAHPVSSSSSLEELVSRGETFSGHLHVSILDFAPEASVPVVRSVTRICNALP